uniref:Zgc:112416 n=1 Tax=Acanthochromis polyacanthus TaxID=80966 RepID=A0A3Q1ECM5_9TELE
MDALHQALRRKQDLLQRLKEQHMKEDLIRPHTWGGSPRQYQWRFINPPQLPPPAPMASTHIYQPATGPAFSSLPLPAVPQPPHIIQQTLPQFPATIIKQLPQQQPALTQIPPPQPHPALRSGSIKEDRVELMLMQNAQMHQIIMHNMMLKAVPPIALSPPGQSHHCVPHYHLEGVCSHPEPAIVLLVW